MGYLLPKYRYLKTFNGQRQLCTPHIIDGIFRTYMVGKDDSVLYLICRDFILIYSDNMTLWVENTPLIIAIIS